MTSRGISANDDVIERAARALIDAIDCPARVILFGSYEAGGDVQFLVIADEVDDRFREVARLDGVLGRLLISADVVLVTAEEAGRTQSKGSVLEEALASGQVIAQS
jgi:predicted nucleotidyltransferase